MRCLATLPLLILLFACSAGAGPTATDRQPADFFIDARVVHVAVEGGFYGLVTQDGQRFDAGPLPAPFRVDGLAVRARLQPLPPTITTHMWGRKVKLLEIERR